MKRWILWITLVTAVLALAITIRYVLKADAQKKREASYQSALLAYSQKVKPGLSRKDVESYFGETTSSLFNLAAARDPRLPTWLRSARRTTLGTALNKRFSWRSSFCCGSQSTRRNLVIQTCLRRWKSFDVLGAVSEDRTD